MSEHLSWEDLNDLVDGRLGADEDAVARSHVQACGECRARMEDLRDLLSDSSGLAASHEAPPQVFVAIKETIGQRKNATLFAPKVSAGTRWWHDPKRLAAAAVLLIAATSATTVLVTSRNQGNGTTVYVNTSQSNATLPVGWENAEQGYLASVAQLSEMLEELRGSLSPATVETVEKSLAIIDTAIVEARSALVRDPANAALADLLASNYRQKVELLRRATELEPRT